jgi:predicted enzyme related to lactoylglutathione lyase
MVKAGNATVMITSMQRAIDFYTEVLGMKLTGRYDDDWATVEAGGFTIGLHPQDPNYPEPGHHGSILIGLNVDDIEVAQAKLAAGQTPNIGPVIKGDGGAFVHFNDPDGNSLYLWQMPKS